MLENLKKGVEALLRSRKFLTSVISMIAIGLSVGFHAPQAVVDLIVYAGGILIATWTVEDVAVSLSKKK